MNIVEDRISIFDTGPGMDGSDENSIVKWYVIAVILYQISESFGLHSK